MECAVLKVTTTQMECVVLKVKSILMVSVAPLELLETMEFVNVSYLTDS